MGTSKKQPKTRIRELVQKRMELSSSDANNIVSKLAEQLAALKLEMKHFSTGWSPHRAEKFDEDVVLVLCFSCTVGRGAKKVRTTTTLAMIASGECRKVSEKTEPCRTYLPDWGNGSNPRRFDEDLDESLISRTDREQW